MTMYFLILGTPASVVDTSAIAATMKQDAAERMKIHRCPWLHGDKMEINEAYFPLKISKEVKLPARVKKEEIKNYTELMEDKKNIFGDLFDMFFEDKKRKGKRILLKGDPGIGKTTLVSKMVYDWAVSAWQMFSIVFLISMKVINPGDSIENIIIDKNVTPSLYSEEYQASQIRQLLKDHGDECLLIFEGFDECQQNDDNAVMEIIKGQRYRSCHVLATARPHVVESIEEHFTTIGVVEGFNFEEANKFIQKFLDDQDQVFAVQMFTEQNQSIGIHKMWRYPILLLSICILVNDGNLDLRERNVTRTDIYERLHNCLYRRYVAKRKDIVEAKGGKAKKEVLLRLGRLALERCDRKKQCYTKAEIEEKIGKEAFHYGIIIGYNDRRIVEDEDEDADYLVCFLHESIQDYLAAVYLMHELENSDRRPEDIWPRVWDTEEVSKLPLMLVFAIDMAEKLPSAKDKLFSSMVKVFNCEELELFGNVVGKNTMAFVSKVLSSCFSLSHVKFVSTRMCDDMLDIPTLVKGLPPSVKILTFKECSFYKSWQKTSSSQQIQPDKGLQEGGLEVRCLDSNVPSRSLKLLIGRWGFIDTLHVRFDHLYDSKNSEARLIKARQFYESFLDLLSVPLKMQNLQISGREEDEDGEVDHSKIIEQIIRGPNPSEDMSVRLFKGNLQGLEMLEISCKTFPDLLLNIIMVCTLPRKCLKALIVKADVTDIMSGHSHLETFQGMLPGHLPVIETIKIYLGHCTLTHKVYTDFLPILEGSRTLKNMTLDFTWASYFMPLLQGGGLPVLENLNFNWRGAGLFQAGQMAEQFLDKFVKSSSETKEFELAVPNFGSECVKEDQKGVCSLPMLHRLDFDVEREEFCLLMNRSILKQFFISVRCSLYLSSVIISGQNAAGCLVCLLHPDGLPSLQTLNADSCNLLPVDLFRLGQAAKNCNLNKTRVLYLSYNGVKDFLCFLCIGFWPSLESLVLSGIELTPWDVTCLVHASKTCMPKLSLIICDEKSKLLFENNYEVFNPKGDLGKEVKWLTDRLWECPRLPFGVSPGENRSLKIVETKRVEEEIQEALDDVLHKIPPEKSMRIGFKGKREIKSDLNEIRADFFRLPDHERRGLVNQYIELYLAKSDLETYDEY